jgi:hypothetical protein
MLKITYLVLLVNLLVTFSSFAQERKIEKNVYSNFREGKFDLALSELEGMRDKYGDKSFFHYWKAYIYTEKISQLINNDWVESNRDSARIFLDSSLFLLEKASQTLTVEELSIKKEDFDVLFPGCIVTLPTGENKYTNCINSIKSDFERKKESTNKLQYNLSLSKLIEEYKYGNKDISNFLKEIKSRVKTYPIPNPLFGEVAKSAYMELASIRNQRQLVQLQKESTDKNWVNYIKTYKEEEYLSIVPNLEKLINDYYFELRQIEFKNHESNSDEVASFILKIDEELVDLETNSTSYIQGLYGTITFSNKFLEDRKSAYKQLLIKAKIRQVQLFVQLMEKESKNILSETLSENEEENNELLNKCESFTSKFKDYSSNTSFTAVVNKINEINKYKEMLIRKTSFEEDMYYSNDFIENFDENTNGWYVGEDQNAINKIANGKFIFENKIAGSYINLAAKRIPTNNENFTISMNTSWIKGIDNNSYEILWGANGFSDYYVFGISASGSYRYMSRQNGNNNILIDWTSSDYINKNGSNILSVRTNENKIELYINYFKVNEFDFGEFYGDQMGMLVNGAQLIEFDDLKIGFNEEYIDRAAFIEENENQEFDYSNIEGKIPSIKIGRLEIALYDFPKEMDWWAAKKACENLGPGWRLPRPNEFGVMYKNRFKIGGFKFNIDNSPSYWSSREAPSRYCEGVCTAYTFSFSDLYKGLSKEGDSLENPSSMNKEHFQFVRPVRSF